MSSSVISSRPLEPLRCQSINTARPSQSDLDAFHTPHESVIERSTDYRMSQITLPSYVETLGGAGEAPPYVEISQAAGSNPRPNFREYEFHLKIRNNIGATLRLSSRHQVDAHHFPTPRFIGGDEVNGVVELNSGVKIRSISLRLKGRILPCQLSVSVPADRNCYTFLDYAHNVYPSTTSDLRGNQAAEGPRVFPFSFLFPTSTSLGSGKSGKPLITDCPIPQTFTEKGTSVNIKYELSLIVDHGALRLDSKLYTPVVYMPKIVAPPASDKRQSAYRQGTSLPGPFDDPHGWHPSAPLPVIIRLTDGFEATVDCNLFLAQPLSYVRGTVIPCYLELSGLEPRISDLVSDALDVRLVRRIKYYPAADRALNYHNPNVTRNEDERAVGKAVWWLARNVAAQTPGQKWLEGEIHLQKDLQSSCGFIPFTIEYAVEIMPCVTDSLSLGPTTSSEGKRSNSKALLSQTVQIASFHQHGPQPASFTEKVSGRNEVPGKDLEFFVGEGALSSWATF